uniref:Uncharacterized protein n=1 Tax=Anguilla anguilla TaxID=7936 RepID=A0A0E9XNL0_ANGAN
MYMGFIFPESMSVQCIFLFKFFTQYFTK